MMINLATSKGVCYLNRKYIARHQSQSRSESECSQQGEPQACHNRYQEMGAGDFTDTSRNSLERRRNAMYAAARQRLESQTS